MIERKITVVNCLGLHARAAAKLVKLAAGFECRIELARGDNRVDAKSIMGLLMLAAAQGSELTLTAEGVDSAAAADAISALFADCFGEGE